MLRTGLVASVILLSTGAMAADFLPTTKGPPPAPTMDSTYSWTGFFLGVNGGYAGDKFKYPFNVGPTEDPNFATGDLGLTSSGFLGGGQIGYNYQFGRFVLGGVADIDASNITGKVSVNANITDFGSIYGSAGSNIEYLGTARGRLGYAVLDNALVYATGGLAYGSVRSSFNVGINSDPFTGSFSGSESKLDTGFVVGGGLEYALTKNVTFNTEYLYADLGKHTILADTIDDISFALKVHTTVNIVRAGLNYKF